MSSASQSRPWDVHRLPSAEGRIFLVTGGNAGIGYFAAEQLAATGAVVVLGSRDAAKADAAMGSIRSRVPGAQVRHLQLDLADLSSLKTAVDRLDLDHLDAVVHNAGVALDDPPRRETADGHELMFGTNHLGHLALTQWLAPLLSAASAGRIVTVGSFAARSERLDLGDLQSTQDYRPKRTYGRSKLAQMYFGFELDRRLRDHRQHGAQRGGPPRRRTGLPHPVPPAGTRDNPRRAAACLARRAPRAGQGRRSLARSTCRPRLGGEGRAAVGTEGLRPAWHTAA